MSAPPTGTPSGAPLVPELGPSLGRLVLPPDEAPRADRVTLDDLRLELVTRLFDLGAAARDFATAGDRQGAVHSLGRSGWLALWEGTVSAAARRIAEAANAHLASAAAEARYPAKRRGRLFLGEDEIGALAARLGSAGGRFVAALDALEAAAPLAARGGAGAAGERVWRDAVLAAARRLETAWLALEATARDEERHWLGEAARVRAWRRPTWPLWLVTALVLALAAYLGLAIGGWLPAVGPVAELGAWWWERMP